MRKNVLTNYQLKARQINSVVMLILSITIIFSSGCEKQKDNSNKKTVVEATTSLSTDHVPENVIAYLNNKLPGWTLPDTSDYTKTWWSFYDKKQIPYYISVDMNDDQRLDYGVILKSPDAIQLVILLDSANTFIYRKATDFNQSFNGNNIQFGLMIEPPKRIDVLGKEISSLVLTSNAIALMNFENRQRIYYWKNGGLKMFETPER